MSSWKWLSRGVLAVAIAASVAVPARATTLIRSGLDELVTTNETVVVGQVLDAVSHWNADRSFILTEVRFSVLDTLKGESSGGGDLTVTLMGGTVGDLTTLIIGGAELVPGRSYVLFLDRSDLPGVPAARTVRDHVQGAFDVVVAEDGLRAVSQANRIPLLPDARGHVLPPGGARGLPLDVLVQSVRNFARRSPSARPEVK
jgi:hypothetical protein